MTTVTDYRYLVHEGTIYRARSYRLPDHWTHDAWRDYWDGGDHIAFYDEGFRGIRALEDNEDTQKAIEAYKADRTGGWYDGALNRFAQQYTGREDARFIVVHLDRGLDFYVLSWDGDPENTWRDEIEAVWNGDIWRMEVERYEECTLNYLRLCPQTHVLWLPEEEPCEEWYGEDNATAALEKEYPLNEFPAELVIS